MKYCIICLLFLYSCAGSAQVEKIDKTTEKKEDAIESVKPVTESEKMITSPSEKSEAGKANQESEITEIPDTSKTPKTAPFELTEFNSQKFSGGAPGSNTVYMYQVKLKKLTEEPLSFKAFWLSPNNLSIDFQLKRKFQADDWKNYNADDEIMLYAQKTNYGEAVKEAMKKAKTEVKQGKEAPYKFESEGLIEYELDGKTFYHEVETISTLPSVNAP